VRACRFARDRDYPCRVDLSQIDGLLHYGKHHLTTPSFEELVAELEEMKERIAALIWRKP